MSASAPSQHEYYIRQPSDTDARGPFTIEQLTDLAKSGGLNTQTLYFDANADQWLPAAGAPELAALIPPGRAEPRLGTAATPAIAPKLIIALLVASAVALLLPAFREAGQLGAATLLRIPYLWLGALDLLLALMVLAFSTRIFVLVRVRAGLALGFLGMLFWMQANTGALAASLIASASLWLATALKTTRAQSANAIAGLAALAALAYCLLT